MTAWMSAASIPARAVSFLFLSSGTPATASGGLIDRLVLAGIVALVVGVLGAYITSRVLSQRYADMAALVGQLQGQVAEVVKGLAALGIQLAGLRTERAQCELRSTRSFATHAEVAHVISEHSIQVEISAARITKVHERMDELQKSVGKISGKLDILIKQKGAGGA